MAGDISFRLSSAVLEWARTSMGYTIEQAAKKAGVSEEKFKAWEKGEKKPTYKQLETLAERVFKRPLAILLLPNPPKEDSIQKDFRNLSNAEVTHLSSDVRLALRKAKRYQIILDEVASEDEAPGFKDFKVSLQDSPITAAQRFRDFIRLSLDEQKSWSYDRAFNNFKNKIEEIGIYIFQLKMPIEEARAFCLSGKYPIIVLNTDDSANGKIFSLFHEACHIFFNENAIFRDKATGELSKDYKEVENFCNQFAAAFLVPDDDFRKEVSYLYAGRIEDDDIQKTAVRYNVSKEVIARKLLSLKIISEDFFWTKKKQWDNLAKAAKEKQKEKLKEQEVKGIAQDKKIISEKGKPYVTKVVSAYQRGLISSSDVSNYLESKLDHLPKIIQRISS